MEKRHYAVYLPEFLGVPKFFVEKIYGKAESFAMWDKWFDFADLAQKMDDLSAEFWDLEQSGKIRAADLCRFKMRFYELLVPYFEKIDRTYVQKKKSAQNEKERDLAGLLWQAHFFALQNTLEYVDFFFWREGKFKNLPTTIKIGYKPSTKADTAVF